MRARELLSFLGSLVLRLKLLNLWKIDTAVFTQRQAWLDAWPVVNGFVVLGGIPHHRILLTTLSAPATR